MSRKYLELFTDSFDESIVEKTKPENKPYVAYSTKEGKVIYTIVPNESGIMYTIYRVVKKDISNLTYNEVDLGLPSGLKWADRNVGAISPEHCGSYFQWGDIEGFTYDGKGEITATQLATLLQPLVGDEMEVTADNVHDILTMMLGGDPGYDMSVLGICFSINKVFDWDNYFDTTDGGNTFIKYNNEGGLTILESEDDAATVHMGSEWRIPTIEEIRELINNTTPTFIDLQDKEYSKEETINGAISDGNLKGIRLTATNRNSIFIPAADWCDKTTLNMGYFGFLWSSSLDGYSSNYSNSLSFYHSGSLHENSGNRYVGQSVRGVKA